MRTLGEAWYDAGSTSLAATVLIGVAAIIVAIWAAFRAAPRQELAYEVRAIVPLLSPRAITVEDLDIFHDGQMIDQPHVVELHLSNRGNRDIATAQFDQDRPLQVDVGAEIRTVLQRESSPAGYRLPQIEISGSRLRIGPDLIKKKQELKISLLVNGDQPRVTVPESPFIDIEVRDRTDFIPNQTESLRLNFGMSVALILTANAVALSAIKPASQAAIVLETVAFLLGGVVILAMTAYLVRSARRARRR